MERVHGALDAASREVADGPELVLGLVALAVLHEVYEILSEVAEGRRGRPGGSGPWSTSMG